MKLIDADKLMERIEQSILNDYNTGDSEKDEAAQGALAYARTLIEKAPAVAAAETKHGVAEDEGFIKFDDGTFIDLDPCLKLEYAFSLENGKGVTVLVIKD